MKKFLTWEGRKLGLVPINKLRIDHSYQRELESANLQQMKPTNRQAWRTLVVSRRKNGYYYVLDGQHRLESMRQEKIAMVACEIHEGLSVKEEARLFRLLNRTRHVKPSYVFRANLVAGEELERDISRIVSGNHLTIKTGRGRPRAGESVIAAVGTLVKIYKEYGDDTLNETLAVVSQAFLLADGTVQRKALSRDFLLGVAHYLFHQEENASDVIDWLEGKEADSILDAANEAKQSHRSDSWSEVSNWIGKLMRRTRDRRRAA